MFFQAFRTFYFEEYNNTQHPVTLVRASCYAAVITLSEVCIYVQSYPEVPTHAGNFTSPFKAKPITDEAKLISCSACYMFDISVTHMTTL